MVCRRNYCAVDMRPKLCEEPHKIPVYAHALLLYLLLWSQAQQPAPRAPLALPAIADLRNIIVEGRANGKLAKQGDGKARKQKSQRAINAAPMKVESYRLPDILDALSFGPGIT